MSDAVQSGADGYFATPIVEPWGDQGWRAGVLLSGGDARGDRPAKSLRPAALRVARRRLAIRRIRVRLARRQLIQCAGASRRAGSLTSSARGVSMPCDSFSSRSERSLRSVVCAATQSDGTITS